MAAVAGSYTGRTFVAGSLAGGAGVNVISMSGVSIDLGQQDDVWVLLRGNASPITTLHLSEAPRLQWGTLALNLR